MNPMLELHILNNKGTEVTEYKIGYFKGNDFITLGKGACTDKDYIFQKIKDTYGNVPVFEKEELLIA